MMAPRQNLLTYDVGGIVALARPAWDWWVAELKSLVPARLRHHTKQAKRYLIVEVVGDKLVARHADAGLEIGQNFSATELRAARPHSEPMLLRKQADQGLDGTIICLQSTQIVRRQTRYPRTSPGNLRQMIEFDLHRLSPLDPTMVYFGFRLPPSDPIVESETNLRNVEIWICRREVIDHALAHCNSLELDPVGISLPDCLPSGLIVGNILPKRKRPFRDQLSRLKSPALATLAAGLMICVSVVAQMREADLDARLESELKTKRAVVQAIEKDRIQAQRLERRKDFLLRQRQNAPPGAVLAELARILPDDAWIYSLEYAKGELRIRGFAQRANELIPALDASRIVSGAQFRSPIVRAPGSGADRFDITVRTTGIP